MKIIHVINIFHVLIYLGNGSRVINAAFSGRRKFHSSAHLNTINGRAHSIETSWFQIRSPQHSKTGPTCSTLKDVFEKYPEFLSSKSLMLGFIQFKKISNRTTTVHDSIFGVKLLEFGTPTTRQCCTAHQVHTYIPITGGVLVCASKNEDAVHNHINISPNSITRNSNFGGLTFSATISPHETDKERSDVKIETQIRDYPPRIAGPPPVGWIRKQIYLKTQSVLHSYVMYRFHIRCHEIIKDT